MVELWRSCATFKFKKKKSGEKGENVLKNSW